MCRFTAYFGNRPIALHDLIIAPEYALVRQSRDARSDSNRVNGDGFGLGWYASDLEQDPKPGVYRSVLPAWGDANLISLSEKIHSKCFIGHVRASTVGSVDYNNCHPFTQDNLLFAHNGTIHGFPKIKRAVIGAIADPMLESVNGQTDTEYFFALFCTFLDGKRGLEEYLKAFVKAKDYVIALQKSTVPGLHLQLNTVLTDGRSMMATRFCSNPDIRPLSLHYREDEGTATVASEPLGENDPSWHAVLSNHALFLQDGKAPVLMPID